MNERTNPPRALLIYCNSSIDLQSAQLINGSRDAKNVKPAGAPTYPVLFTNGLVKNISFILKITRNSSCLKVRFVVYKRSSEFNPLCYEFDIAKTNLSYSHLVNIIRSNRQTDSKLREVKHYVHHHHHHHVVA